MLIHRVLVEQMTIMSCDLICEGIQIRSRDNVLNILEPATLWASEYVIEPNNESRITIPNKKKITFPTMVFLTSNVTVAA